MPPALSAKLAGLPRWAWLGILSSGLLLGLYLRNRQQAADAAGDTAPDVTDQSTVDGSGDPSVGFGSALVGAEPAGVVPVDSPVIPEGFPEVFQVLGSAVESLSGSNATLAQSAIEGRTQVAVEGPPPPTGGGPPTTTAPRTSVVTVPAGYTRGNVVHGRTFPNAIGYRLVDRDRKDPAGKHYEAWLFIAKSGAHGSWRYYTSGPRKGQWVPA
jgi:hypothetical protein